MATTARDARTDAHRVRERLIAATPLSERHHELAGIPTAVLEGGEGPPIVLLHGQGEFWGVWLPVIDDLVRRHRVVVVDLPGHGASGVGPGRLDEASVLRWVDELIDRTCPTPPVVAGHLLGGAIAARYAVQHGGRLSHLVLVDTLGLAWFRPSPRFAIPMVRFVARPTEQSRDRLFHQCFVDFDRTGVNFGGHWEDVREYALACAQSPDNQAALRALMPRVGVPAIPRADLDLVEVPTTLIHGRHDLQVSLRVAKAASQRHGWPLHVIDDARDDPVAEQPEAFLDVLGTALGDHPATSDETAAT